MKALAQKDSSETGHIYDIYLTDAGDFAFSSDREAYGNIIADAIRTLEGELQLDIERGIPYQRTIWETISKVNIWKIYVKNTILAYPFVTGIENMSVNVGNGKNLTYTITIQTDLGVVEVSS